MMFQSGMDLQDCIPLGICCPSTTQIFGIYLGVHLLVVVSTASFFQLYHTAASLLSLAKINILM